MKLNLASTRLAFVLIALLAAHLILSAIIPQADIATGQLTNWRNTLGDNYKIIEFLRLDRIYTFPAFYALLGLLGLNLLIGNVKRFRTVYRVERTLLKARHIGSIIFHLGLLSVLTCIVINYLFKYDGVLALTTGQRIVDEHRAYFREFLGPLNNERYGRFRLQLDSLNLAYPLEKTTATAALVTIWPAGSANAERAVIHTNHPYARGGLEIHYGLTYGYSPELQIIDSSGNTLFKRFVRLATQSGPDGPVFHDYFVHQETGLHIDMTALSRGSIVDSTQVAARITRDGDTLADTTISPGDTLTAGAFSVAFPRMRLWSYLTVVENPWLSWVFVSFWLAIAGLTITFAPRVISHRR